VDQRRDPWIRATDLRVAVAMRVVVKIAGHAGLCGIVS
jgi:hypothetical protein